MFSVLLSGLRSLRVSLVTGGVIVASVYIFLFGLIDEKIAIKSSALSLLEYSDLMPAILFVSLSLIVGSLYTTLLEGIVDSLHRKNVPREITPQGAIWGNAVTAAFLPYSESARLRLIEEVERFFRECTVENSVDAGEEKLFVERVMIEVLWMEGKLSGTVLESPYDKIKSEGEMRVSGGLLLPLAATTAAYSVNASDLNLILSFSAGMVLAVPTVNYGLYYYRKANSFLAHHIADGKILSPSMETLKRATIGLSQSTNTPS